MLSMTAWYWLGLAMCLIGFAAAFNHYVNVRWREKFLARKKKKGKNFSQEEMIPPTVADKIELAGRLIRKGAWSFIGTQYSVLGGTAIAFAIAIGFFIKDPTPAIWFFGGCLASSVAGVFGMHTSTHTNHQAAKASLNGLTSAMRAAFPGGATMGLFAVSLAFAGLCIIGIIYPEPESIFTSFSLGATLTALFARAGGGMFTKGADVAADLVGKIALGIPEDSPKNPAVLADWIGDMVNDCAGMGADLIDSLIAFLFSAILLFLQIAAHLAAFPIIFMMAGLLASVIGSYIVSNYRFADDEKANPAKAINVGTYSTYGIFAVIAFVVVLLLPVADWNTKWRLLAATGGGIFVGVVIGLVTDYYNNGAYKPVRDTAEACKISPATGMINSTVIGQKSVFIPMVAVGLAVIGAFKICEPLGLEWGMLGVTMCGMGLVANIGIILAVDAFGPIADNAQGIGSFAGFNEKELYAANKIDELGNTTAAWGKGLVILLTAITSINLLMAVITQGVKTFGMAGLFGADFTIGGIALIATKIIAGGFIGAAIPWMFSGEVMSQVNKIALKICDNIFKQTRDNPKILEGTADPDYNPPIKIATYGALTKLLYPAMIILLATTALRFIPWLGPLSMLGYLLGAQFSGTPLAISMANTGGNADNGKKICESGEMGPEHGKGSQTHKNAVVGDTVGDPLKDTGSPSINGVITAMNLITLFYFMI